MTRTQVDFNTTKEVLGSAKIAIQGKSTASREEALAVAAQIGFPVVMKLISPDIIHKADVGAVILDIGDAAAAAKAYDTLLDRARQAGAKRVDGVLVQKQARAGFEVLVGARQDPIFGPLTMVGFGGKFVELFKDVVPGVGVLNRTDVERMINSTKAGRVLDGFRGPPLDKEAVIDLVLKVSLLMDSRPDINELDLNPVIVYEKGCAIVDARMILGDPIARPGTAELTSKRMASLQAIFEAKSVAVVGASKPGSVGGIILKNSRRVGKLYPINPKRDTLLNLKCYKTLKDLPEPVDVGVFAVGPEATIQGFQELCEMGGKGAIIVSDGFAEIGRSDLEDQLVQISRRHDVVYIGPNGLGVVDNFSGLNTQFIPIRRTMLSNRPGPIAIITQSGGVGMELLEMLATDNVPVGKWVSCGNASGVSIAELLAHMADDSRVKVIALYIEGLQNGVQFLEVGRKVAEKKPVLVIKGGTGGGAAKTMSHTASLAGSFEAFKAACRQAGFYLLEELTEDPKFLVNVLSILTRHRPTKNNRAAVISVGGGAAIMLADQLTAEGMRLATFSDESKAKLTELLSLKWRHAPEDQRMSRAQSLVSNPLDVFGDADDDRLLEAIRILDDDPNTDLVIVGPYFQVPHLSEYIAEGLIDLYADMKKPLIVSLRGYSKYVYHTRDYLTEQGLQVYTVPMIKPLHVALDIWKRYEIDFTV